MELKLNHVECAHMFSRKARHSGAHQCHQNVVFPTSKLVLPIEIPRNQYRCNGAYHYRDDRHYLHGARLYIPYLFEASVDRTNSRLNAIYGFRV